MPSFNDSINFGEAFCLSLFLRLIESMMGFRLRQGNLRLVCKFTLAALVFTSLQLAEYYMPSFNDSINFGEAFCLSLFLRLIESMMGFRLRQGNLRLVFRLFSLMRGLPSIRLK